MDRINMFLIKLQNRKHEGQGMVEYALVLGLVAIGSIVALGTLNTSIGDLLERVAGELDLILP
jgi:Flp pilus assembly pilin Flp